MILSALHKSSLSLSLSILSRLGLDLKREPPHYIGCEPWFIAVGFIWPRYSLRCELNYYSIQDSEPYSLKEKLFFCLHFLYAIRTPRTTVTILNNSGYKSHEPRIYIIYPLPRWFTNDLTSREGNLSLFDHDALDY